MAKKVAGIELKKRKEVGSYISQLIRVSLAEREPLKKRWDKTEAYYRGDPSAYSSIPGLDGAELQPFALIQPMVDSIADNIVSTIFTADPVLLCKKQGTAESVEHKQRLLQHFIEIGNLKDRLETAAVMAGCTDLAIIRQTFQTHATDFAPASADVQLTQGKGIQYCGGVWDVIHPADFICSPGTFYGIKQAPIVGHRTTRLRGEIEEMCRAGIYYELEGEQKLTSKDPTDNESGVSRAHSGLSTQPTPYSEHDSIELFSVIVKLDLSEGKKKGAQYYEATVAPADDLLLKLEPYSAAAPHYYDFRLFPKRHGLFWPTTSVGSNLHSLQWQYTNIGNMLVWGSWIQALPPMVTNGPANPNQTLQAGKFYESNGNEMSPVISQFNPGMLYPMMGTIKLIAQSVSGMSEAGLAQGASSSKTATQQMSEDAGQSNRVGGYVRRFGSTLAEMANDFMYLLWENWDIWYPLYGETLGVSEDVRNELVEPCRWTLANANPNISPNVRIQQMNQLIALAQSDQQNVLQKVMALVAQAVSPEVFKGIEAQVVAMQGDTLDIREIIETIVNQMQLQNGDKILRKQPEVESDESADGSVLPGAGVGQLMQLIQGASGGDPQGL